MSQWCAVLPDYLIGAGYSSESALSLSSTMRRRLAGPQEPGFHFKAPTGDRVHIMQPRQDFHCAFSPHHVSDEEEGTFQRQVKAFQGLFDYIKLAVEQAPSDARNLHFVLPCLLSITVRPVS